MQEVTGNSPFPTHFDGRRFYNPGGTQARGLLDVLRWKVTSRAEKSPKFIADIDTSVPPTRVSGAELRTTLVNHSTVLIQQSSANILTDPIWSLRASPVSWMGPRRRRNPGVRKQDLPPIHVVLITHNHYDHLDLPTLRWLAARGQPAFVAPIGVAKLLQAENMGPVYELDWGDECTFGETTIHCVPAVHFSARGLFDRNRTLWCGYVIRTQNQTIYFAGDTGFGEHFDLIRQRFGAPRLAFLPIGAYDPRWFMAPIHMSPQDALRAHEILGAGTSIAIHHGTFQLTDENIDAPKKELLASVGGSSFLVLDNGQSADVA
jgi:L-ascorbate metabolism protein UlaG (beta-lactamase superfamily)